MVFGMGAVFLILGSVLLHFGNKKIVIDRGIKALWRGKKDAANNINTRDIDNYTSLKKLHALQLIKHNTHINSNNHNGFEISINNHEYEYENHELNLVFNNGKRLNLLSHGNNSLITSQAEKLSEFLSVPLWDGRFDGRDTGDSIPGNLSGLHKQNRIFSFLFFFVSALFNFKSILAILIFFTSVFYFPFLQEDPDPKIDLSTVQGIQKEELRKEYTHELFERAKISGVNLVYMNKLADTGIDIDAQDEFGRTPLFYAVKVKNLDNVTFFLRRHANVNIRDKNGIGLKDMLDKKKDTNLYYRIVDAELEEDARSRGKTITYILRSIDKDGNVTDIKINEE